PPPQRSTLFPYTTLFRSQWASKVTDREDLHKLAKAATAGEQIAWAFETLVEPLLAKDRPVFVVDHPIEVSPLARKRDSEPRLVRSEEHTSELQSLAYLVC